MNKKRILPTVIILGVLIYFFGDKLNPETKTLNDTYLSELESYWVEKNESRKNGYLQLIALRLLKNGENSFGKDASNQIQFDREGLPPTIATIYMTDSLKTITAAEDVRIATENDSIITTMDLILDEYGSSVRLYQERLNWQIVTRSNVHYLRVWDTQHADIETWKGFETFETNPDMILEGEFTYYEQPKSQMVKSEVDGQRSTNFVGKVEFEYESKIHALEVGGNGFTMVGDLSSGDTTYGGGRYLYLDLPEDDGIITIDFNKLYNPPCAFNLFTTCLYPPQQNHLPFMIEAGEALKLTK